MTVSALQWARDVLATGGWPDTPGSEQLLVAQARGEEAGATRGAAFNPLNTTQSGPPGTTAFNSFGPGGQYHVRNYPDYQSGLERTVAALKNGNYPHVVAALAAGDPSIALAAPHEYDVWGTGGARVQELYADTQRNWPRWAAWVLPNTPGESGSRVSGGAGNVAGGIGGVQQFVGGVLAPVLSPGSGVAGDVVSAGKGYVLTAVLFGGILIAGLGLVVLGAWRGTSDQFRSTARTAATAAVIA